MKESKLLCKYCNKECSKYGLKNHQSRCNFNPNKDAESAIWRKAMKEKKGKNQWTKAKETGVPYVLSDETRNKISNASKGRTHTHETRKKISIKRKKYLEDNPDKVPYLINHFSNGPSYAERYWQGILDAHNINYIAEHRVSLYSLDFAIPEKKIDLEIDGDQHYLDNRIVESDKRRTDFLQSEGWTVIRIKWSEYQSLNKSAKEQYVNNVIAQLTGP